ncbi:nucleotide exchange factor GrpE [candidate division KSB1 bacterium]|nr:nucleotide exchange factor GrpE [candidate division KSB1 bacterium]
MMKKRLEKKYRKKNLLKGQSMDGKDKITKPEGQDKSSPEEADRADRKDKTAVPLDSNGKPVKEDDKTKGEKPVEEDRSESAGKPEGGETVSGKSDGEPAQKTESVEPLEEKAEESGKPTEKVEKQVVPEPTAGKTEESEKSEAKPADESEKSEKQQVIPEPVEKKAEELEKPEDAKPPVPSEEKPKKVKPTDEEKKKEVSLAILEDLKKADEHEYDEEDNQNQSIKDELDWIQTESSRIPEGMIKLEAEFEKIITENFDDKLDELPEELKENLTNRQDSLNLCHKMLKRLDRLYPQFKESQEKVEKLPELKKYVWHDEDIRKLTAAELEEKVSVTKKELEAIRDFNYHSIRQKRELYQKQKSYFKKFFKDYFFYVIDGLVDGQNFYEDHLEEWIKKHDEQKAIIQKRYNIYNLLIDAAEKTLADFHIFPIPVKEGDEFDEHAHDPFMTEPDKKLKDNQIKEISKKGYKFVDPDDEKSEIMRSPQVIVVKNTGEVNES